MAYYQDLTVDARRALDAYKSTPTSFTNMNTCIRVDYSSDRILITIRGSDDMKDWLHNSMRWTTPFIGCRVHTGFLRHMMAVEKMLDPQHMKSSVPVYLVGHSLGGAVATLLGILIAHNNLLRQVRVTTFGAPRVGRYDFKLLYQKLVNFHVRRVVSPYDIVTKIPFFGFYHIGTVIVLPSSKSYNPLHHHRMNIYLQKLISAL
jgi:predicted lipase